MRTYDAIDIISKKIIEDNLCDAILLKSSIGRGDDEYSDVDMSLFDWIKANLGGLLF